VPAWVEVEVPAAAAALLDELVAERPLDPERVVTMPATYSIEPWLPAVHPSLLRPIEPSYDDLELAALVEEAFLGLGLDFEDDGISV
jgi:hypothetical protein